MQIDDASFFNPTQEYGFLERSLPHLDQPGSFAFVTFRLIDSIPVPLVKQLAKDRGAILAEAGLNPRAENIAAELDKLSKRQAAILRWKLFLVWDEKMDQLRGDCYLRRSEISKIVADGLLKFDRDRYLMATFVVMPNPVHLLQPFRMKVLSHHKVLGGASSLPVKSTPYLGEPDTYGKATSLTIWSETKHPSSEFGATSSTIQQKSD